ncbi:hypothetical protein VTK56DRAFT_2149 [Thermocarpiscus australiensis]
MSINGVCSAREAGAAPFFYRQSSQCDCDQSTTGERRRRQTERPVRTRDGVTTVTLRACRNKHPQIKLRYCPCIGDLDRENLNIYIIPKPQISESDCSRFLGGIGSTVPERNLVVAFGQVQSRGLYRHLIRIGSSGPGRPTKAASGAADFPDTDNQPPAQIMRSHHVGLRKGELSSLPTTYIHGHLAR